MSKRFKFTAAPQRSPKWFALRKDGITATDVAEKTAQHLTSVIRTLSTSLQLVNSRYDAKCKEYDALLMAYNALVSVQETTSKWGERGATSWADEPM